MSAQETGDLFGNWRAAKRVARFGKTYSAVLDGARLQLLGQRVFDMMRSGEWFTLQALAAQTGGSEAGCSARVREIRDFLRETRTGDVERSRVPGAESRGLFRYRVVPPQNNH